MEVLGVQKDWRVRMGQGALRVLGLWGDGGVLKGILRGLVNPMVGVY